MKKLILGILSITAIALIMAGGSALGEGNQISLSVSCVIPAIPGVNAPPFETKENVQPQKLTAGETEPTAKKESPNNAAQSSVIVDKRESPEVVIKTVYNR